jgi:Tir chaperone protein (CesT) family
MPDGVAQMSAVNLSPLMREAGFISLRPEAEAPDETTGGAWILPLSDVRVDALHDTARERLILNASAGQPLPWYRNELFELILQYNDHCEDTGVRLGLEEEEDTIVIVMDLPLGWLANGGLARAFFTLLDLRESWQRIVEKDVEQGNQGFTPSTVARHHPSGHIHV